MAHPQLLRPPIHEAVLEINCSLPVEDERFLEDFEAQLRPTYTRQHERRQVQLNVAEGAATSRLDGLLLQHGTEPYIVQGRFDGFALSRLRPYDRWAGLRDEARRLWGFYLAVFRPERVVRLGLRFINTIDIDVKDSPANSLTILPSLPDPVAPAGLNSFTLRLATEYPDFGAAATILEHLPPIVPEAPTANVILDIDVYKQLDLAPDDPGIWEHFDQLRELKNFIFFSSLTSEAVRRYEQ